MLPGIDELIAGGIKFGVGDAQVNLFSTGIGTETIKYGLPADGHCQCCPREIFFVWDLSAPWRSRFGLREFRLTASG